MVSLRTIAIDILADDETDIAGLIEILTKNCMEAKVVDFTFSVGKKMEVPK